MKKLLMVSGALLTLSSPTWAVCPTPLTIKDAAGTTQNVSTTDDGSGSCQSNIYGPDGNLVTIGSKADNKSAATDTTPITIMSVLKQVSASIQAAAASLAGTLTVGLPSGAATSANQTSQITQATTTSTNTGATAAAAGTTADAACTTATGTCTLEALLKFLNNAVSAGVTGSTILSAASNNSANIKASAGILYSVTWLQTTTTLMDIRFYDTSSAPTCSSATSMKLNFVVQSNAISPGATIMLGPSGVAFTTGIGVCITGANANNDNTNAVTGLNLITAWQ